MAALEVAQRDAVVQVGGESIPAESVPVEQGRREAIALNRLFLSQKNARKVRNPESIPALAAMIESQGLLYPLCVVPEQEPKLVGKSAKPDKGARRKSDGKGKRLGQARPVEAGAHTYGVVAGGRRLAALQWLVQEGRMAEATPIDCLVLDVARGAAVSLTENIAQEPMHPADQLVAFKALVDEGQSAGQIAAAFGVSVLTVQRRLKLASLAPQFIDLYREGGIEMDGLQALALSDDPAQQVKVWESLKPYNRSAYQIRQLLTDGEVEAASPLAVFVGIEAYRAAGGAVREDLFSSGGDGDDSGSGSFLQDAALLNRLALDRLEAEAAKLREGGWKWVDARISFPYAERSRFAQLHCDKATPGRTEQAAIDAVEADRNRIRARVDELEALAYDAGVDEDSEWTPEQQVEYDTLEEQCSALESQLEAMDEALREWTPQQKAIAGVVLCVDRDGQICCVEGLVSAGDRKAMQEAAKGAGQPCDERGDDSTIDGDDDRHRGAAFAVPTFDKAPKERAEYPALLCQSMTAHRTAAVAAAFTQNPKAALAALLHTLVCKEREPWLSSPVDVKFNSNMSEIARAAMEYDETPAAQTIAQAEVVFDQLPGDAARLFDHLQSMDVTDLLDVLALYVARAYSVVSGDPLRNARRGFDPAQGIERVLGVDMADWWRPTPARYLRHVSKARMVEAVTEACGAQAARPLEKMKKDEAVKAAALLLQGKRWLPSTLRPYPAANTSADPVGADDAHEEGSDD
jgi:ParB family chromosome partitioning protein